MKIYLIEQSEYCDGDYYDSAVVFAENEEMAKDTDPCFENKIDWNNPRQHLCQYWCLKRSSVNVKYIGESKYGRPYQVICANFNSIELYE